MLRDVERRELRLAESGARIGVLDWGGDGPLALFHHANGFGAALWDLVAEGLRGRFRVVAMDARGHGDSSEGRGPDAYHWESLARDWVSVGEDLVASTGAPHIELGVGHSFGGALALSASAQRPGLFRRLLLVDPVLLPRLDPERVEAVVDSPAVQRARKRRRHWPDRAAARAFFAGKELFADWDPRALDLYVEEGLRPGPEGGVELKCATEAEASIFGGAHTLDLFAAVDRVRVPTRLLRSAFGYFPRDMFERVAARLDDAGVEDIEAGHLAPMERPDLVAEAILRFAAVAPAAHEGPGETTARAGH